MRTRFVSRFAPFCLAVGCGAAEPESLTRELDLADEEPEAVVADLIVEVVDGGRPVVADRVFASHDDTVVQEATCIVHASPDRCKVWSLEFSMDEPITLVAELCGKRHAEAFALDLPPQPEGFTFGMSVTLRADGLACADALPDGCGGDGFAEPALSITAVDDSGRPRAVHDVQVQHDNEIPRPADCMEGTGGGCSEWASPYTGPGRYHATVEVCGKTFASDWVEVTADAFGCAVLPKAVTLVVDQAACRFANGLH